jgi:DNA-binding MarR family transcriptional regulator
MTAAGRRTFRAIARTHGDWIAEIFAGMSDSDLEPLMRLLAKAKTSAGKAVGNGAAR